MTEEKKNNFFISTEIDPVKKDKLAKLLSELGIKSEKDLMDFAKLGIKSREDLSNFAKGLLEKTEAKCGVCGGMIVKKYHIPYITAQADGKGMLGPASHNIATINDKKLASIQCYVCGIKYEFVPTK